LHFSVQAAAGSAIESLSHQAGIAVFFFVFGRGATVAFKFALEAPYSSLARLNGSATALVQYRIWQTP